jgi:quercetin dioxygenase-like cupin family protein
LLLAGSTSNGQVVGGCETPVTERKHETGCYLVATSALGKLPVGDVFWHIYRYSTLAAANAVRTARSSIVQSHGKVLLYAIADKSWRPASGERIAIVGPLPHNSETAYTARYMEATIPSGVKTPVHVHAGPEAWYVFEGAQCLETPEGITVVRAGEGALVRQGPEMMLSSVGAVTRRTVLLVLHDASQPWIVENTPWKPKGLCPP